MQSVVLSVGNTRDRHEHPSGYPLLSSFIIGLKKRASSVLRLATASRWFLKPTLELVVFSKQQLQGFADDIRFRRIDELCVLAELGFNFLLYANLNSFILRRYYRRF